VWSGENEPHEGEWREGSALLRLLYLLEHFIRLRDHIGDSTLVDAQTDLVGDFEMNVAFRFGGTPYEVSERGLKLFAKEVLPVVKSWKSAKAEKAAA